MNKRFFLYIIAAIALIVLAIFLQSLVRHNPKIYIWAWERTEDLRFLKNSNITIVYYAGDVVIKNGEIDITPRRNMLFLPPNNPTIPLVRIDNFDKADVLDDQRLNDIKKFIVQICSIKGISGCQIDFDALTSERSFYTKLISAVKKEIPPNIPLSITALVSWCDKYSWLDKTEIDFAVPMFYRLGPDSTKIRNNRVGQTFMKAKKCQSAVGVATDEQMPTRDYLQKKDIYFFNPQSWIKEKFAEQLQRLNYENI